MDKNAILAVTVLVVSMAGLAISMGLGSDEIKLLRRLPWGIRATLAVTSASGLFLLIIVVSGETNRVSYDHVLVVAKEDSTSPRITVVTPEGDIKVVCVSQDVYEKFRLGDVNVEIQGRRCKKEPTQTPFPSFP